MCGCHKKNHHTWNGDMIFLRNKMENVDMTSRFINAYMRSGDIHITAMPKYCSATLEILSSTILSP
ncbi:hypothetical protein DPMN_105812 [Dreissena polymorpha]|uniref:Uncharacterized protein n=1 Tax=Dreissena polymorpha TaxID=45954 RepID=A0A9D4K3U8_DREPO|nr:hypothetical protein DPMN_105812 [Dreissena polymorpha]